MGRMPADEIVTFLSREDQVRRIADQRMVAFCQLPHQSDSQSRNLLHAFPIIHHEPFHRLTVSPGLWRGVLDAADFLRSKGHIVYSPDLYNEAVFDDLEAASKFAQDIGIPGMIQRTMAAAAKLPQDFINAGFSNSGASAGYLAGIRPGTRGCLLFHAALPLQMLGIAAWPKTVPVQLHYTRSDSWRNQQWIDQLSKDIQASGASFEFFECPVDGLLFTDPDMADYDAEATSLLMERAAQFIAKQG